MDVQAVHNVLPRNIKLNEKILSNGNSRRKLSEKLCREKYSFVVSAALYHDRMTQIGQVVFNSIILCDNVGTLSLKLFIDQKILGSISKTSCMLPLFRSSRER